MDLTANQQYSFPICKNAEILECLLEVGIELSEAELTEPGRHKDKVRAVFSSLLTLGMGLEEGFEKTTSGSLMKSRQSLPYPELHEESIANLKFLRACQKFMRVCGIHADFGNNDLAAPIPKRFKRQLSAVINFIKFKEERMGLYSERSEERDELFGGLVQAQQERENLMEQLRLAQAQADERWEEMRTTEEDCAELESEIAQQNKVQTSIRQESTNLKKRATMLKDQIATAELAMTEMEAEERKLLPQVVESPDTLQGHIGSLNLTLNEEQHNLKLAQEESKLTDLRVRNVKKAQSNIVAATQLSKDIVIARAKFEKLSREATDIQNSIDNNSSQLEKLEHTRRELQVEVKQLEKTTEGNRKEAKIKSDAISSRLQVVNDKLQLVEKDRRDAKATLERHEQEVQLIQTIIQEEKVKSDEEIKEIITSFHLMEKTLMDKQKAFDDKIRSAMEIAVTTSSQ
eukprot:CAMPEP_0194111468 /NCGR_PEP_ID=MMETSP0150-20130528/10464_1 /TAXON_ID=122233 /ORGANISM="Chaetoceros debilis, Strain MM31A-1" /LENGTH=459 /DNA_ID=CAMNT_0038800909 /DNA_START=142 /DNA_END=1521 /DNA_ORIENTATION=+